MHRKTQRILGVGAVPYVCLFGFGGWFWIGLLGKRCTLGVYASLFNAVLLALSVFAVIWMSWRYRGAKKDIAEGRGIAACTIFLVISAMLLIISGSRLYLTGLYLRTVMHLDRELLSAMMAESLESGSGESLEKIVRMMNMWGSPTISIRQDMETVIVRWDEGSLASYGLLMVSPGSRFLEIRGGAYMKMEVAPGIYVYFRRG